MLLDCSTACVNVSNRLLCNEGCNGGWAFAGYADVVSWGGLETDANYPYVGEDEKLLRYLIIHA